jgi:hypothetical protein
MKLDIFDNSVRVFVSRSDLDELWRFDSFSGGEFN